MSWGAITAPMSRSGGDQLSARHPDLNVILVGPQDIVAAELKARRATPGPRLIVRHASQVVAMDEAPALALRGKKDSSMRVAIDLVNPAKPMPACRQATPAP